MHDTAVGSANFTGGMPAPRGDGGRSPATEGRWTRSNRAVMDPQDRHRDRQRRQSSTSRATTSLPKPSDGR